jgi:hypothetical protein
MEGSVVAMFHPGQGQVQGHLVIKIFLLFLMIQNSDGLVSRHKAAETLNI